MDGRLRIILLAAVLAVSGCRDEQAALTAPPDPEAAGAAGADEAGPAVAVADSTTEAEECDLIEVEVVVDGETRTVYLCRRESEAAGGSASADGDGGDGTQICWYWVVEYRIAGILVSTTEDLVFCEDAPDPNPGEGGGGPSLTLSCPESAKRDETVDCSFTWLPSDAAISDISWEFEGGGQLNSKAGDNSWSGVAVAGGTFRVSATVGGQEYRDSATIEVTERGGGAWIMPVSSGWDDAAVAGCTNWDGPDADAFGLTVAPATCHSRGWFEVNYSVSQGSGPWAGLYYVTDPDAPLVLRAALRPEATGSYATRTNRDLESRCKRFSSTLLSVTMEQANVNCDPAYRTVFENAIAYAIQHEDDHMDAGVVTAIFHNLYAQWDAIIGTSEAEVRASANDAAGNVDDLVNRAIGTADHTHTGFSDTLWYHDGGWDLTRLTLGH